MARRMFSTRIVSSARFLKMPISSQALYFHLGTNADDDGIVEAYNVLMSVGCSEDDLKVLVSKGFVQVLNEDLVSYITDWRENNRLRSDRKIDSIYKDLLLSMNPSVELLERTDRADRKKAISENGTSTGRPRDVQWTDNGRSMDGIGKDSIGEDSLVKDSEEKSVSGDTARTPKKKYGEYKHVLLTDDEFRKLGEDFGKDETLEAIRFLDEYIEMKGYKAKSHYLAIRKWVFDAIKERQQKQKPKESGGSFENERKIDYMKLFGQGD